MGNVSIGASRKRFAAGVDAEQHSPRCQFDVHAARTRAILLSAAFCLSFVCPARAAITTTGNVTPDPSTTTSSDDLYVANTANGTMLVNAGSDVVSRMGYVGFLSGVTGLATVDGAGSTWTTGIAVGYGGEGALKITNGGRVISSGDSSIGGPQSGSMGAVTVDGVGSTWTHSGELAVGHDNAGTLDITNGGQVTTDLAFVTGATAAVTVDGAGSTWTNGAFLVLGYGNPTLSITGGGTVDTGPGGGLFLGVDGGAGAINLINGVLRLHFGELTKGPGAATFNFAGGRLEWARSIDLGGALVQNGGTLAPGNSAGTTTIYAGYTLDAGTLEIEINGTSGAGIGWDLVGVNGAVNLLGANALADGVLDIHLGFAPSLGSGFLILANDGADPIVGTFAGGSTIKAPYNNSLYEFAVNYTSGTGNDVGLWTQAVSLLGDYNGDGAVNAADYVVWRKTLNTTVNRYFGADGNGNGQIDAGDLSVWRAHFGQTNGSGSGTSANFYVPEPTTLVLLLVGIFALFTFRRGHLIMKIYRPCHARFVALRCARLALGIMVSLAAASATRAANKTWTAAASGDFGAAANWTGGVPGTLDTATFNVAGGPYTVTFDNNPNPLATPVNNQDLFFSAGTVTFTSGTSGTYTYHLLTGPGGEDANITGGTLTLGTSGNPLHMSVDDDLVVQGGATLNVNFGSQVNTVDLLVAQVFGSGNGTVVVDGSGSTLNATTTATATLGKFGNTGTLTYRNAAQGSIATAGSLEVGISGFATTAGILNVESDADLDVGNLIIASSSGSGTVNINGIGSTLDIVGTNGLTVGSAAGPGALNVGTSVSSGTVTIGTGAMSVNANGTATIGSGANTGTLITNGNVAVNAVGSAGGAVINVNGPGSAFTQSGATTLSVGHATTGTGVINIGTSSSGAVFTTGTGLITINQTGSVNIGSGANTGTFNANGNITINGLMTVDGSNSKLICNGIGTQSVGTVGTTGALTIQNGSTLNTMAGALGIADAATAAAGVVSITGGARLALTGNLTLASQNIVGQSGTLNINGPISELTQSGSSAITVGSAVNGTAAINIGTTTSGGTLYTGAGLLTINKTGTVNIGSGASTGKLNANGYVTINGGVLNAFKSHSLEMTINKTFTVQNGGQFTSYQTSAIDSDYINVTGTNSKWELVGGSNLNVWGTEVNVDFGGLISVTGDVSISHGTLTIQDGGTLITNALTTDFGLLDFRNGTLGITTAAGLSLGPTSFLGTNFSLGPNRILNVSNTTTIPVGSSLSLDGGTLTTTNISLSGSGTFAFHSGTLGITGAGGLAIGASGPLGSTLLIDTSRALHVTNTLTVNSGAYLAVAGGFSAANAVNNGDLVMINTAIDAPVVNNHAMTVVGTVDFNGLVSGPGGFFGPGTAHFNGGIAPGASPASVSFEGSVALADTNTLFIEIGGTTAGSQYDRLTIAGSASLDGILNISLINGFTPTGGQQFTILTAGSIVDNGFVLAGSAASSFNLLVNSTSVILQAIGLAGDYNHNGIVDAADYVVWRKYAGTSTALSNDLIGGTIGSPQFNQWRANFGKTAPGAGSGTGIVANATVPEPATLVLMMFAATGWCLRRRRAA